MWLKYFQLLPIPATIMNIPGRMSIAEKQILFKAILPPLGFNIYYFQIKSKFIVLFSINSSFIYIAFLIAKEYGNSKVKTTYNELCTLQNQVRYAYLIYIKINMIYYLYSLFEWNLTIKEIFFNLSIYKAIFLYYFQIKVSIGITVSEIFDIFIL